MVRYPDILTVSYLSEGTYDGTGDYVVGDTITETVQGRAEPNGKGAQVMLADGAMIVYSYLFYSEVQHFEAPFNSEVTLSNGWTGTVKRQANNQKSTLIWL